MIPSSCPISSRVAAGTVAKNGAIVAKMRLYLVDNRLYQVMVLGNGPFFVGSDKDVTTFLDSFRLNK